MGLLTNLVLSLVHLLLVAADVLFLLLLATMLGYRWQPPWLMALNSAGKPAVDWLTGHIERGLDRSGKKAPSERMVLFIGMLAISLIRLFGAACVAVLSVVGLLRFFGSPDQATPVADESREGDGALDFILLPYIVLAFCVLLLLAMRMVWPRAKPRHPDEDGRSIVVEEKRRVKKGTDDRAMISPRRRPGKGQATDHRIRT